MAQPTGHFPLATDEIYPDDVVDDGSSAGAAGTSNSGLILSRGALIAIIVVVVGVALVGSESNQPSQPAH